MLMSSWFSELSFLALMADSSEWQFVRRGRGKGRPQAEKPQADESVDRERDKRRITEAIIELRCEDFWPEWKEIMSCCLAETVIKTVEGTSCRMECVCYGLGNFSSCMSARYQLAMLLLLLDAFQIAVGRCSLYDPVFTVSECETLSELGFTVLTENEEGKRAVCCPTLFYLMHCGKALYNNLLWKNWSPQILPKVIVIGNSFLGIQERYFSSADNTKHAKDALTVEMEMIEKSLKMTTTTVAETTADKPKKTPRMEVQVGSSSRESSLKGLFEEIVQEHDEHDSDICCNKLSHTQKAHSSTGQSTKFGFPRWLPLLQSFSVPLVPVWTVRDCSAQHLTLWMKGDTG